jgi:predicted ATPase
MRHGVDPMRPFRTTVRTGSDLAVVLEALTREVPLLLIFEDLQWTDKVTLACLDAVTRRHPGAALCIVGTYSRTANVETGRALERLGRDIRAQHRGIVIRLTALTSADVHAMVARALGPRAAAATASAVFDVAGGHPAQVARAIAALGEMVSTFSASGDDWTGDHLSLALSTMVAEGVQYQIDELGTDDRIVLETAAVIGSSFTAAEVAAALDLKHVSPIVRRLEGLAAGGILIEEDSVQPRADADSRYRFRAPRAVDLLAAPIPISRCTRITSRARRAARLYARSS